MNYKMVGRMTGLILLIESGFMIFPLLISFGYKESSWSSFVITMAILVAVGATLLVLCRTTKKEYYAKEGFVICGLAWILISAFGALPFVISGVIPQYINAFFETVSGFTTTGASILLEIASLPRGILFWRSLTHWIGGMGMLVFLLAVVPSAGGHSVHLLRAESPGPSVQKMLPRMRDTAKVLYMIYFLLTIMCFVMLVLGGMPAFDSICTAMGTAGTGGFSVQNDSMASYTPYMRTVVIVFMLMFGANFNIYYLLLIKDFKSVLRDDELKTYLLVFFSAATLITLNVYPMFETVGKAIHESAFAVSSIMTTTGFSSFDFAKFPEFSRGMLVVLMLFGASAGSTGGGFKIARLNLIIRSGLREIKRMIRPRSVEIIRVNKKPIDLRTVHLTNVYLGVYALLIVASCIIVSFDNFSFDTNVTAVISCFNNIGPGLGMVGPSGNFFSFSVISKLVLCADMLLGRLEIFPLLILIHPATWAKH